MQEQRPGMPIMTIDEFIRMEMKDMAFSEDRFMKLVEELRESGFSQQEAIEEARERLSKDEMSKKKRKAPSIKMAEADFDPLMDEYMKYLDEMKEIDKPPMSLREFEAEARLGVRGGGLAYLMGM